MCLPPLQYLEYGVDLTTTTHARRFRPTQQMTPTNSTAGPTKGLTIFSGKLLGLPVKGFVAATWVKGCCPGCAVQVCISLA